MRPLMHPSMEDVTLSGILHALSDATRRMIFVDLVAADGVTGCSAYLSMGGNIPKSTLSNHFRVLREAGLIFSERSGTSMVSRPRTRELQSRFEGLIQTVVALSIAEDRA
jgi:DNA-binding transcriptional ArsR family regulator